MNLDDPVDLNEAAVAHVQRGYRHMQYAARLFSVVIVLVTVGILAHIFPASPVPQPPLPVVAGVGAVILLSYLPVVRIGDTMEFRTTDAPEAVRDSFLDGVNPLNFPALALADDGGIDVDETGVTTETTQLAGLYSTRIRHEAEEHPDGDIEVRSIKNGSESTSARVSIRPEDGETLVTIDTNRANRISPRTTALLWLRGKQIRKAFEELGYEIVHAESSIGVLG